MADQLGVSFKNSFIALFIGGLLVSGGVHTNIIRNTLLVGNVLSYRSDVLNSYIALLIGGLLVSGGINTDSIRNTLMVGNVLFCWPDVLGKTSFKNSFIALLIGSVVCNGQDAVVNEMPQSEHSDREQ